MSVNVTITLCIVSRQNVWWLFPFQQLTPLLFHLPTQFGGDANLFGKVLLPVIGPGGIDDRHRCSVVALCHFFWLQPWIDPRAPNPSINVHRRAGITATTHGFKHFSEIVRIYVFIYQNNKTRVVTARAAQSTERRTHRMAGKRLLNGEDHNPSAVSDSLDTGDAQSF